MRGAAPSPTLPPLHTEQPVRGAAAGKPHIRLLLLPRHSPPLPPLRRLRLGLLLHCNHRSTVLPSRLALPHHRIPLPTFSFPKTRQGFLTILQSYRKFYFTLQPRQNPSMGVPNVQDRLNAYLDWLVCQKLGLLTNCQYISLVSHNNTMVISDFGVPVWVVIGAFVSLALSYCQS